MVNPFIKDSHKIPISKDTHYSPSDKVLLNDAGYTRLNGELVQGLAFER
jgi:hypothetical protein